MCFLYFFAFMNMHMMLLFCCFEDCVVRWCLGVVWRLLGHPSFALAGLVGGSASRPRRILARRRPPAQIPPATGGDGGAAMADRLAPRSPAWCALWSRAVLAPGRGRWVALLGAQDVEVLARAIHRSIGQLPPSGLARAVSLGVAALPLPAGPFNVDDLRVVLAGIGLPVSVQDLATAATFAGVGPKAGGLQRQGRGG